MHGVTNILDKFQSVTLSSANGEIHRVLFEDLGDVLLVCTADELAVARAEMRRPALAAFRATDVIDRTPVATLWQSGRIPLS